MKDCRGLETLDVKFKYLDDYLYVFVTGDEDTIVVSLTYWEKVMEACRKQNYKKVLINEDFEKQVICLDSFDVAECVERLHLAGMKIAFVDEQVGHHGENKFVVRIAKDKNVWIKVFDDAADAKTWLLSEEK